MTNKYDLTDGDIFKTITRLALPIMGTSFIQMAYNLTDMLWIGRIGSNSVAAVGTAGFFLWFAQSIIALGRIGAEVFVAQKVGEKNENRAGTYANHAIRLNVFSALLYGLLLFMLKDYLIGFFNLGDAYVYDMAIIYLRTMSMGMLFMFMGPVFTGIYNGAGNSSTPFKINILGLAINMVMDPVLIFGVGGIPPLGVLGAAIATIFSQFIVVVVFLMKMKGQKEEYFKVRIRGRIDFSIVKEMLKLGFPVALQTGIFAMIGMALGRIIASYGPEAMAAQKVGAQLESLSWMTANGFSTALSAFVAQNYGAGKHKRIIKGYGTAFKAALVLGLLATSLFLLFSRQLFYIFIREEQTIGVGINYLRILGFSQVFMTLEITTQGAFNGLGKTAVPSATGVIFNALRVPLAYYLSGYTFLDLNGVWWTISITSFLKGIILVSLFYFIVIRRYNEMGSL